MKNQSCNSSEQSLGGPTVLLLWIWKCVTSLPETFANIYKEIIKMSGAILSRFTLLDAMGQFILAFATSCHPQEDIGMYEKCGDSQGETELSTGKNGDGFPGVGKRLSDGDSERTLHHRATVETRT